MSSDVWHAAALALALFGAGIVARPGQDATVPPPADTATEEPAKTTELRRRYAALLQKKFMLERERQLKDLQLELSGTDAPYLVIDLEAQELRIAVKATMVRTISLGSVAIEGERQMFSAAAPPPDWANRTYTVLGKSGPRRAIEKVRPGEGLGVDGSVNPRSVTAEMIGLDEEQLPARFTLLFNEGAAVSIGGRERLSEAEKTWLTRGLEIVGEALVTPDLPDGADGESIQVWVHLAVDAEDARTLYPTVFTGMRAMFRMPGDPRF